jgi:hypothetical protein
MDEFRNSVIELFKEFYNIHEFGKPDPTIITKTQFLVLFLENIRDIVKEEFDFS